jgi:hypothetical protein
MQLQNQRPWYKKSGSSDQDRAITTSRQKVLVPNEFPLLYLGILLTANFG